MADITLNYAEMGASVADLKKSREDIQLQLSALKGKIDSLTSGAFRTTAASGNFQQSYAEWTGGANQMISGLDGMAGFLEAAVQKHQELDSALSSNLG